jgi:hypothetical protein
MRLKTGSIARLPPNVMDPAENTPPPPGCVKYVMSAPPRQRLVPLARWTRPAGLPPGAILSVSHPDAPPMFSPDRPTRLPFSTPVPAKIQWSGASTR